MRKKYYFLTVLLLAFFCLFLSCKEPVVVDENNQAGIMVRLPVFSHKSGLYSEPFELSITVREGFTVYYSIDGSVPDPEKADGERVFKYESPITVKDRNGQPNFLATAENIPFFYVHPDDERHQEWGGPPEPFIPTAENTPKATVIRAIAVDSRGRQSNPVTCTYFIGDNLAGYGNNPVISIVTDPFNLLDYKTGIYVRGAGLEQFDYNFYKKGREWEREANIDFFNGSKNVQFSTGAGIRVRGGWSRDAAQKSWNIFFRQEYGINNLTNYQLIPGAVQADGRTPVARYKSFMLRNGGNDTDINKFRDSYIQSLLKDRNFTTQAAIPCVVYLNGEYWGPYNLQERYSDNYLENRFGVDNNNVISVKNGLLEEGVDADMSYFYALESYIYGSADMTNPQTYKNFCDNVFDIQSFIDYFAAELYIGNDDWPDNNLQIWRVRNREPNNPYGDQKWRFMMYDLEYSMGLYEDGRPFDAYQKKILGVGYGFSVLFQKLLKNDEFFRQFIITLMDLYNVNFDYASNMLKLNEVAAVYKPLMADYEKRFGSSWKTFDTWVNDMKSFMWNIKDALTKEYLPKHFGERGITADKLANITIFTNAPDASVKINTTTANLAAGSWTGKYYSTFPVTLTANGGNFNNWTVTGGSIIEGTVNSAKITVAFDGDVLIKANYSAAPWSGISGTEVDFIQGGAAEQIAKINITSLVSEIKDGDMYLLDISGIFNQDIFADNSAEVSIVQGDNNNETLIADKKRLINVPYLAGGTQFDSSAFFLIDGYTVSAPVYLKIKIGSDIAGLCLKYSKLLLGKKNNKYISLFKSPSAEDWTDALRISHLGLNQIKSGQNYKVTIKGVSPAAIQQFAVALTDENGNALTMQRVFSQKTAANQQFTLTTVIRTRGNGNAGSYLSFSTVSNVFPGRTTPVLIECTQLSLEETEEGPRDVQFYVSSYTNDSGQYVREYVSETNILLSDYYDKPAKPGARYNMSIYGTTDTDLKHLALMFFSRNWSWLGGWSGLGYIPQGNFIKQASPALDNFSGSIDVSGTFIRFAIDADVPNHLKDGDYVLSIKDFYIDITEE